MQYWIPILSFCFIVSCGEQVATDRTALAKVGTQVLYEDELPTWVNNDSSDQLQLQQSFIDQWIRKKSMVNAAEEFLGEDLDIEQLLQDYKESLLMVNLEQELVKQKMDTFVTNMQVSQYFNEHGDDFLLREEALKILYIQCQDSLAVSNLDKVWNKKNLKSTLSEMDLTPCNPMWLDNETFVLKSKITATLPESISKKVKWESNRTYDFKLDSLSYFLKIDDVLKPREKTPLSLVQENIIKLILHDRKMTLMKEYENDLIEEGIQSKYITLYNTQ